MSQDQDRAGIIEAHQDLVEHVERSATRIRVLSVVTIVVALVLAVSYAYELLLPSLGTTSVTVNLADPANVIAEIFVLALAFIWLYVGIRDLRFSSRLANQIKSARLKENEIRKRITG